MANVTQKWAVLRETPSGTKTVVLKTSNRNFLKEYLACQNKNVYPQLTVYQVAIDDEFNTKEQIPFLDPQTSMWPENPELLR